MGVCTTYFDFCFSLPATCFEHVRYLSADFLHKYEYYFYGYLTNLHMGKHFYITGFFLWLKCTFFEFIFCGWGNFNFILPRILIWWFIFCPLFLELDAFSIHSFRFVIKMTLNHQFRHQVLLSKIIVNEICFVIVSVEAHIIDLWICLSLLV